MRKTIIILTLILTFATFTKAEEERIRPTVHLNKAVPKFSGVSLSGRTWTNDSLKGKVTLIAFWSIGCYGCMLEINHLNKLNLKFKNKEFQMISIAPKFKEELNLFNSNNKNRFSKIRKQLKAEPINYEIIPTCTDSLQRTQMENNGLSLMDCFDVCKDFNVQSFPVILICDKNGIVREITEAFTDDKKEAMQIFKEYATLIEKLLKE